MPFCFYPELEQSCPNVSHCPHLGGAAIGTVVLRANDKELFLRQLHGTIDAERNRNDKLSDRLLKTLSSHSSPFKLGKTRGRLPNFCSLVSNTSFASSRYDTIRGAGLLVV
jgi:hypothetical protein